MTMRKFLFFIFHFSLFTIIASAQTRYCVTWQDYLDGQWRETESGVVLQPSAKGDALAMEVKAPTKKTATILRKRVCVMEWQDSLYLNLRPFNTFGDVYVRAWRIGDKLLFARQDIAPSHFSIANGDSGIPFSKKSFSSLSRLENLVCYLAAWDPNREELRMVRVTKEMVLKLLSNHPQQLADYQATDKKSLENADVVISILQKAGVIR